MPSRILFRTTAALILWFCFARMPQSQAETTSAPAKPECSGILQEVERQKALLKSAESSLDALTGLGGELELPLSRLFNVDVRDADKVQKRIEELIRFTTPEAVNSSPEFSKYLVCFSEATSKVFAELATLQAQLNARKLAFLSLEAAKRDALLGAYTSRFEKMADPYSVRAQLAASQTALALARADHDKALVAAQNMSEHAAPQLATALAAVAQYRSDIETENLDFIASLDGIGQRIERLQNDLASFSKLYDEQGKGELYKSYTTINGIWQQAAELILELYRQRPLTSQCELPAAVEQVRAAGLTGAADGKAFDAALALVEARKDLLTRTRTRVIDALKIHDFRVLSDAGSLRAHFLRLCDDMGCSRPHGLNSENLRSLGLELQIVPLKLFAGVLSKGVEIRGKFSSGIDGWIDLGRQSLLLGLLLLIPFFLIKSLAWVANRLNQARRNLLTRSLSTYHRRHLLAAWVARLTPFVPSVGMIVSIAAARMLLAGTDVVELADLLFYFQIFYFYRLTRQALTIGLELVFSTGSIDALRPLKARIETTATNISRVLFSEYVLLHLTEDAVRRAIAYQLLSTLVLWGNVALAFFESVRWRAEIQQAFAQRFPKLHARSGQIHMDRVQQALLPFLFAAVVAYDVVRVVGSQLIKFDLVKRLSSDVFRKRLEREEPELKQRHPAPDIYLQAFDRYLPARDEILVSREDPTSVDAIKAVEAWTKGVSSSDLLMIVGNRGMGKSTILGQISASVGAGYDKLLVQVPGKITSQEDFFAWLSTVFAHPVNSAEDVRNFDAALHRKLVICVDCVQNLFLGSMGGFDAYRVFVEVISLTTKQVFWCLTINSRSWTYLNGVLGAEHFYGQVLQLSPWSDIEIQRLILARHASTGFARSFDNSIKAYGANDALGQQAEAQFFRLLWGQSRGNPRSALRYWTSSVSCPTGREIHVGIPEFIDPALIAVMSDEALFLFSAIARHENLTHNELRQVTCIEDAVIRKCVKEALDKDLIWSDAAHRLRISSRAQYVVDYYLVGKNFLYE